MLRRHGISRRARAPRPPANRYEYAAPGELVHLDIKQLGRFWQVGKRALGDSVGNRSPRAGWQYLHLAVDDHSRYAVAQLRPTQTSSDAVAFLEHALERFAERGIPVQRIMSDNGSCYVGKDLRRAVQQHGLRHLRTRPYTPRTNGKAEALIRILLREWAYGYIYPSSSPPRPSPPRLAPLVQQPPSHTAPLGSPPPITRVSHAACLLQLGATTLPP